jgi:hypothetical protein
MIPFSLKWEYDRDVAKGMDIAIPKIIIQKMIRQRTPPATGAPMPTYCSLIGSITMYIKKRLTILVRLFKKFI